MLFLAILYTVLLILCAIGALPAKEGSPRFPVALSGAVLVIMLAIIGYVIFNSQLKG